MRRLLCVFLCVLIARPCLAAEYHVTVQDDLKAAVLQLQPGDTLWLGSGNYLGGMVVNGPKGTADAPITVRAEVDGQVTVDRSARDGWNLTGTDYWTIQGVRFMRNAREGLFLAQSSHITLINCAFGENGDSGLLTGHSTDLTAQGCEFYGSKGQHGAYCSSVSSRFTFRDCAFYRNRRAGFQANNQGATNPFVGGLLENCRFWSNGSDSLTGGNAMAAAVNLILVSEVRVKNCDLHDNWANGVSLNTCTSCTLESNSIQFRKGTGWRCISSNVGASLTNVARLNLFMMGQPKPPIDGVLTQSNNTLTVMPTPVVATPDPTPVPSPIP